MTEDATYMNTLQATRYLGLSEKTLRRYRVPASTDARRSGQRRKDTDMTHDTKHAPRPTASRSGSCPLYLSRCFF